MHSQKKKEMAFAQGRTKEQKEHRHLLIDLNLSMSGDFGGISSNSVFLVCGLLPAEMSEGLYGIWAGNPPKKSLFGL